MAVVVKCSICEKFIKNVDTKDLRTLTGNEICPECGKKLSSYLSELENYVKTCKEDITVEYKKAVEIIKKTEPNYKGYIEKIDGLFTTMKAEVNAKLQRILNAE